MNAEKAQAATETDTEVLDLNLDGKTYVVPLRFSGYKCLEKYVPVSGVRLVYWHCCFSGNR